MLGVSLLVVALSMVVVLWWRTSRRRPPGPMGLPLVGYLPWLDQKAPHLTLTKLSKKYGKIYGLYLGNVYTVVLSDAQLIRKVFMKDVTTGRAPLFLTHGIMKGYGLICAEGERWKDQRRFVCSTLRDLGAFKSSWSENTHYLIKHYANVFLTIVLEHQKNGESILDPLEGLRHCLGSIMNHLVFGKHWEQNDEQWKWLQNLQEEGTKLIGVAGPLNFLPWVRFLPKYAKTMEFILEGQQKTHKLYQELIEELEGSTGGDKKVSCLMEAFILERKKRPKEDLGFYTDQQFYCLLADIFGAGLDTTLTTLRWALLFVSMDQDLQSFLRSEYYDIDLLSAIVAESQRIRSVVPVGIPHGTLEDMDIEGYSIPKGTMLVPLQWAVHMNEKVWEEPERFNPYRFMNKNKPLDFIPFQTGKRMCVGDKLADSMLIIFLEIILKRFSICIEDQVDLSGCCGITLTPEAHRLIFIELGEK